MADVLVRLDVQSQEYENKLKNATKNLQHMEQEVRRTGATFAYADKEEIEFVQSLGNMETHASTAKGKISEMTQSIAELSLMYKRMSEEEKNSATGQALSASLDQLKVRLDDYKTELSSIEGVSAASGNAITSIFEGMAQKVGIPMNALQQLGNQGFAGVAQAAVQAGRTIMTSLGPIGAIIAAIVLAVKQLVDAFKRNEDAMTALQNIAAPFKAVWQSIQRLFDDIVKVFVDVYNNVQQAAGGFSIFRVALAPVATVIATVRAGLAVVGTLLTDLSKGVKFVADSIRGAIAGSKVATWLNNITTTVKDFMGKLNDWVGKIANSRMGKALGLDKLAAQLKEIATAQSELTASNKKIAASENELLKLRRQNTVANARDEQQIAKLREQASEKDKYNAEERVKMLEQAAALEERIMQRNVDQKRKELEVIKLKNSLTQSGTEDLNAQANAEAAVIQAETEFYNKKRALQRQLQASKNEVAGGGGGGGSIDNSPVDGSIAAQEELVKSLTEKWKNASAELRDGYKKELDEARAVLDKMLGKVKEVEAETEEMTGPKETAFEQFSRSVATKQADDAAALDNTTLTNLMGVAIQNRIDSLNPDFEILYQKMFNGENINDAEWQELADAINEKLANLGLDPIVLDVKTGGVQEAEKQVGNLADNVDKAIGVFGQLGNAMQQIDDPGAKVAGIVMGAVAEVAASFAGSLKGTFTPWDWIAAAISGVSTMIATISAIKSATSGGFANGGIVPGNSFSGDNLTANVNSGELILNRAQQGAIAGQLEGNPMNDLNLGLEVEGTKMLLLLNNTNRSLGGSRSFYSERH